MQNNEFSKTLKVEDGKLIRTVNDIEETKRIIEIISKKNLFHSKVVGTKLFSETHKKIEHEFIQFIIHSGEYTESMGYDVQKNALNMAFDFMKDGIWAWDFLAHNFTYHNGTWFLYDFDSLSINPAKVITQLRGFFKITFSNYEILKLLKRKELKHYYLTRYRIEDIIKLIPFHRWLFLAVNMIICQFILNLKQYKLVYKYLNLLFDFYSRNYKKQYYTYVVSENENKEFSLIDEELNSAKTVFCIGELAGKWAINNEEKDTDIEKFVYIDDYDTCDKYYNFIYSKEYKKLSCAVLYPLVDEDKIDLNLRFNALYDSYAQTRFYSDAVISFEEENVEILSKFTSNILIVKSEKDLMPKLLELFDDVKKLGDLYIAKNKKDKTKPIQTKKYDDSNRGPDAHRQTWEVLKIIQKKRHN